jgi:hypothetical protein
MNLPEQVQLGSTLVRFLDSSRVVFRDAFDSSQVLMIHDADVPLLIHFLHQWSESAQKTLIVHRTSGVAEVA